MGGEALMWLALAYQVRPRWLCALHVHGSAGAVGCACGAHMAAAAAAAARAHTANPRPPACAPQACGREQDCIDTYKWLEDNHPVPKV